MVSKEEILNFWGDNLVKIPIELLNQTNLDEATKIFLSIIGLPVKEDLFTNKLNPDDLETFNYKDTQYIVLTDNHGIKICLQEATGEIFSVDVRGEYPTTFINSDIKSLVIFMQIFEDFRPTIAGVPDSEIENVIQELKKEFLKVDPKALSNEENWWVVILEQLSYGLL